MWVHPWFGILLLVTTLIDWSVALHIQSSTSQPVKKIWLLVSILTNLGCLCGFKYAGFIFNTFSELTEILTGNRGIHIHDILIPAGLSFYTFQSMGYIIDVYRKQIPAERNILRFALFVSFFPQLVAGPIERYTHLGNQLQQPARLNMELFASACRLMLWGFLKKIAIADRLALLVDPVFDAPEHYSALSIFFTGFLFVVQVYCDFSGYSDIASGVARLFGVELMINWRRPLLSRSVQEFWIRNHISMTSWFRDYLYISLGGNKCSPFRSWMNIFITFLLSGLWHGAAWTFVIWGALHGLVFLIEREITKRRTGNTPKWLALPGWIWLIGFHTLTLLAFRANSWHDLQCIVQNLFTTSWNPLNAFYELRQTHDLFPILLGIFAIVLLFIYELAEEKIWLREKHYYISFIRPVACSILFLLLFLTGEFGNQPFIYFQF
jgi:D-alanyl-lipoteichoic acid acyltransferase DltB (MBOAT superfamily)